jgi:hypothetical protein
LLLNKNPTQSGLTQGTTSLSQLNIWKKMPRVCYITKMTDSSTNPPTDPRDTTPEPLEPKKTDQANRNAEKTDSKESKEEWTTIRVRRSTVDVIRHLADQYQMSQAEVLKAAITVLPDAMTGMDRYTWLFLDQTLNRLEETLAYNMALRESLEDLVFELIQVEKELSFNLDDLNDSIFAPNPQEDVNKKQDDPLDF